MTGKYYPNHKLFFVSVLILMIGLPTEFSSGLIPEKSTQTESPVEVNWGFSKKFLGMSTPQNVCLACDLVPVQFEKQPVNRTYIYGSSSHVLVWTANYFTNYTVMIDGEIIAHGLVRYEQDSVMDGRLTITKIYGRRTHEVGLDVDNLELGTHPVKLLIWADSKYACPEECCICGAGGIAEDTVFVTIVEPPVPCTACMRLPITMNHPSDVSYIEGSSGNYVVWSTNWFGNFTVSFDGEVVVRGRVEYDQKFLSIDRVNITKGRTCNVSINVDGFAPGRHSVSLKIREIISPKCCPESPRFLTSDWDTVGVNVEPAPESSTTSESILFIPGFRVFEGVLALVGLVGIVCRDKFRNGKRN